MEPRRPKWSPGGPNPGPKSEQHCLRGRSNQMRHHDQNQIRSELKSQGRRDAQRVNLPSALALGIFNIYKPVLARNGKRV